MLKKTFQAMILAAGICSAAGCSGRDTSIPLTPRGVSPDAGAADYQEYPARNRRASCDGTIVDILIDNDNCGSCGIVCEPHTTCYDGECRFPGYLDSPCADQTWCGENELCLSADSGLYCVDRFRWGCEFDSDCEGGEVCIDAYCTAISGEVCDNIDNDRNGTIDDILPRPCYTSPSGTSSNPPCHPGLQFCQRGSWGGCEGEVTPRVEEHILLCDGVDNDCDGCPDNRYDSTGACIVPEPMKYDIAVIMDVSGSMADNIMAAIVASTEFARVFDGDPDYQFALFVHPFTPEQPWMRTLQLPFSDYSAFRSALERIAGIPHAITSGAEQSYDIPFMVATGVYGGDIGFREDARRVYIMFTDEVGQTHPYFGLPMVSEALMCSSFREDDISVIVTHPEYYDDFDACAMPFRLTNNALAMAAQLRSIFGAVCDH